jgi:flavin-dependent dehydrogenase
VDQFDFAVCGAGIAGSLAGYVCARLGRRTAIIGCSTGPLPGEVLAANAATTLARLELRYLLDAPDHVPCQGITRVAASEPEVLPWSGIILNRAKFASDLLSAAIDAGCHSIRGRLTTMSRDRNVVSLDIDTGGGVRRIAAAFVIDASGRASAVARRMGASRHVLTNLAAAWVAMPSASIALEPGTLAIEAAGSDWWYLAIGRESMAAAVLGRRPPRTPSAWMAAARSTSALHHLTLSSVPLRPHVWPANVSVLEPAVGDSWIACGDAAATFDPLSGYGLAFAVGSGYAAARAADSFLSGDRLAPLAYLELIASRVRHAWNGLGEAYEGLAPASIGT